MLVVSWEAFSGSSTPPTHTLRPGYTQVLQQTYSEINNAGRLSIAHIIASAGGVQSYDAFTSSVGGESRFLVVCEAGTFDAAGIVGNSTFDTNGNNNPNPPALTLDEAEDWLVVAVGCTWDGTAHSILAAPTNYLNLNTVGPANAVTATAERTMLAAASENPGTFAKSATIRGSTAATVGILGAVSVTPGAPHQRVRAARLPVRWTNSPNRFRRPRWRSS